MDATLRIYNQYQALTPAFNEVGVLLFGAFYQPSVNAEVGFSVLAAFEWFGARWAYLMVVFKSWCRSIRCTVRLLPPLPASFTLWAMARRVHITSSFPIPDRKSAG